MTRKACTGSPERPGEQLLLEYGSPEPDSSSDAAGRASTRYTDQYMPIKFSEAGGKTHGEVRIPTLCQVHGGVLDIGIAA